MSLGYALLHPHRMELSFQTNQERQFGDELFEMIFGTLGIGDDLGTGFREYLQGRFRALDDFVNHLKSWFDPGGPLSFLRELVENRTGDLPDVGALLEKLADVLSSAPAFKEVLRSWIYEVIDGLPDLSSASISLGLREQFDAITQILETPLRSGKQDRSAHQAFRSAVLMRQLFGPYFEQVFSASFNFDLKALLRGVIDDLLAKLDGPQLGQITATLKGFSGQFGGLISALFKLNASFSVSAEVSVSGPQGMADGELTADQTEALAATHPPGHALWCIDLVTSVFTTFCSLWEMIRTSNFKGREFDGTMSVLGFVWQIVQTVMRLAFRDKINLPTADEQNLGKRFENWIFTDQGNFAINLLNRFLGSTYDMHHESNWALGFALSSMKYYSNEVNTRVTYLSARSYWYFYKRRKEGVKTPAALNRVLWAVWGPIWFFCSIFGLTPAWEDFSLETGFTPRTIVTLIVGLVLGVAAGYVTLGLVSGSSLSDLEVAPDWPTFTLIALSWVLMLIVFIIIIMYLRSKKKDMALGFFIAFAVLLLVPIVGLPISSGLRGTDPSFGDKFFMHWLIVIAGVAFAGVLPYILWWFYTDDGRDKLGYLGKLNADTSPYKLPFRNGENWLCSQGVHGIFSHYVVPLDGSANDNLYSYDFSEHRNQPCLAARGGIVVDFTEKNENDKDQKNFVTVQHVDWLLGHDPGTDDERVLTLGQYFHLSQNRAWVDINHRLVQGYHLLDIDNTGRSALNHLHLDIAEQQRSVQVTVPFIFADKTIRRVRNFPLITSWWSGGWHIDGKPISGAFYESENSESDPVINPVRIQTLEAGSPSHSHMIEIDRRTLGTGAIPDSLTLFTVDDKPVAGLPAHVHKIEIARADLVKLLGMQPPDNFALSTVNGHTHGFGNIVKRRSSAPSPAITIANAPPGQLMALLPAPYRLIGDQLVLRVNDRATEYFLFGAHRPALAGDVALDRGIQNYQDLQVGGATFALSGALDQTVRGSARQLNILMRSGGGGVGKPIVIRCLPAIVIETRRRGRSAALEVTFRTSAARTTKGTGAFDDIGQITPAALAAHIDNLIRNGWPAGLSGLTVSVTSGQLKISAGGSAVDLTSSSSRIAEVLSALYDAGSQTMRATGTMPLSTGRIVLGVAPKFEVPLLGTHAQVRIDTTNAAFLPANLISTPLVISALGMEQNVILQGGDNAPAALARRINANVEGVRAFPDGTDVVVQTIAGGSAATVKASKAPTGALGSPTNGVTAVLASNSVSDSAAVSADSVKAMIDDAVNRHTLPYDATVVLPSATVDGTNTLKIAVAAPHTIELDAANFTGSEAFQLAANLSQPELDAALPANIALSGPAWLDLKIDGKVVRIPFDGEAARLDIPPLDRMPANNEQLVISINGGAPQSVTFTGTETSIADVAAKIAQVSSDIIVRIAWVMSFENTLYQNASHKLEFTDTAGSPSPGLAQAGFLRDRSSLHSDNIGVGNDQLALDATLDAAPAAPLVAFDPHRDDGELVSGFTISEQPSGSDLAWKLQAPAGFQIRATPTAVATAADPDPLGFSAVFANSISTIAVGDTVDLKAGCREYRFDIQDAAGVPFASATTQLTGTAAMARTVNAPEFSGVSSASVVNMTVTEPGLPERAFALDVTGVTSLDTVADRINQIGAPLRAWVVQPPAIKQDRLHIETSGLGNGWRLRLDNAPALLALGFARADIDIAAGTLTASGGGTMSNTKATTRTEIRAALDNAAKCTTHLPNPTWTVAAEPTDLVLRSLEGPVTIETEPDTLRVLLNVTEFPDRTVLSPGPILNTDNGSIIVKVGGRAAGLVNLWGTNASLHANRDLASISAADITTMLGLLTSKSLKIRVDGAPRTIPPAPASSTTIDDVVQWMASQAPEAWIGIAGGHVVFQSRGAGSGHSIQLDFSDFVTLGAFPASTVLGFEAGQLNASFQVAANGRGSVARREDIGVPAGGTELETLLRSAAQAAAAPQAIFDVEDDIAVSPVVVRIRTHLNNWTLEQPLPLPSEGPAALPFNPPGGASPPSTVLETPYPAPQAIEAGEFKLRAHISLVDREVSVLLAGQAARLPALQLPASMDVLNGTGFDLTVSTNVFKVVFAAVASTTPADIAAQIERQCKWSVRAQVTSTALVIETFETGSAKVLTLSKPSGATANAITNNSATGFSLAGALPAQVNGAGSVPATDLVSAADLQSVLLRAYIGALSAGDQSKRDSRTLDFRAYDATAAPGSFLIITSNRLGCMSSVESLIDTTRTLALSHAFEHGPAIRGSVALQPITSPKSLSGTLSIELNDNGSITDVAAPVVVPVTFPPGQYTARDVARVIQNALFDRGIGQAGAYPDGTVVVETLVNGLAGTVRIPAPDTGKSGPDQTLLQALLGSGGELFGRGYPGAGFSTFRTGARSRQGPAKAAATWIFTPLLPGAKPGDPPVPGTPTAPITIAAGQNLADIAQSVDSALASVAGGRIGFCVVGPDDTLYIEDTGNPLMMTVNGVAPALVSPANPGETPEYSEDPAVGLRFTQLSRTVRYARDRFGNGVETDVDDAKWVRLTADLAGNPGSTLSFPSGVYWTAVRSETAKTRNYDPTGEMIISGGADDSASPKRFFVHRARYWIAVENGQLLGVVRNTAGDLLVQVLV